MPVEPISLLDLKPGDKNDVLDRVYTDRMRRTIADAKSLAEARGETIVNAEHFFLSIGDDGCANAVLAAEGVSLRDLQDGLRKFLPDKGARGVESKFGEVSERLVVSAKECARSMNHTFLGDEHLLYALAAASSPVSAVLQLRGLTADRVRQRILDLLGHGIEKTREQTT